MKLPTFKYYPDPIATGSIEASDVVCRVCQAVRGYIYSGVVWADEDLNDSVCPWCIADGKARELFNATFTDEDGIGDYGHWESVPEEVTSEIAYRTPGFIGWQQSRWFTHCKDGCAFLGLFGHKELAALGSQAVTAIQEESGFKGKEWKGYFESLDKEGSPTAYVFKCLHCGIYGGYSDFE